MPYKYWHRNVISLDSEHHKPAGLLSLLVEVNQICVYLPLVIQAIARYAVEWSAFLERFL